MDRILRRRIAPLLALVLCVWLGMLRLFALGGWAFSNRAAGIREADGAEPGTKVAFKWEDVFDLFAE